MEKRTLRFEATESFVKALRKQGAIVNKQTLKDGITQTFYYMYAEVEEKSGFLVYDKKALVNTFTAALADKSLHVEVYPVSFCKVGYTTIFKSRFSYLQTVEVKAGHLDDIQVCVKKKGGAK